MSDKEILERAIKKALDGGWTKNPQSYKEYMVFDNIHLGDFIFNHDFAKALWGKNTDTMTVQNNSLNVAQIIDMNGWRYHLQQMVLADDPIKYLGEHIDVQKTN